MNMDIKVTGVRLETPRLILRPWRETDLQDLFAYASVPGVGEMAGWPHHETLETSRRVLEGFLADGDVLALEYRANGRVIGSLGVHEANFSEQWASYRPLKARQLGYVLAREYWGQGLMPEAVRAVLLWLFDEVGLDAVTIGHFTFNDRSRRVIEKCGFQWVEKGIFHARQLNADYEEMRYILLREKFIK